MIIVSFKLISLHVPERSVISVWYSSLKTGTSRNRKKKHALIRESAFLFSSLPLWLHFAFFFFFVCLISFFDLEQKLIFSLFFKKTKGISVSGFLLLFSLIITIVLYCLIYLIVILSFSYLKYTYLPIFQTLIIS